MCMLREVDVIHNNRRTKPGSHGTKASSTIYVWLLVQAPPSKRPTHSYGCGANERMENDQLQSRGATMGEADNQPKEADNQKFRSVLPHEPLPIGELGSDLGYIHLQGAFEPKRKTEKKAPSYWKSANVLEENLLIALRDEHERLRLPFPAVSVSLLDPNHYSRLRIEYAGPYEALQIQHAFRDQRISPSDLLASYEDTGKPVFGGRACQATMITTHPLPQDSSTYWPRSNPPQFRRILHDRGDDQEARSKTRFVYVTGLLDNNTNTTNTIPVWWYQPYSVLRSLRSVFGSEVEVFLPKPHKKQQPFVQSCHIGFRSATDAQDCVRKFQGASVVWESGHRTLQSGQLFLDYATITQKSKSKQRGEYEKGKGEITRPECTSVTAHVNVPGLVVVEDFLSEEEEQILVAVLTGPQAPWSPQQSNKSQTGAVKRLVQHYGYVFDYQTADVLRREETPTPFSADCPPLPICSLSTATEELIREGKGWDILAKVVQKTRNHEFEHNNAETQNTTTTNYPDLNQMTVNHYKPGEGIGSHIDTTSAFGDGLISISLNSGIVMEFTNTKDDREKKLVYLPRRSVVLMSGPSRYEWEHQIVTRRTDTHNGKVLPRGTRISLTLRTALSLGGSPLSRYESSAFPPVWGNENSNCNNNNSSSNALVTPSTERDHVHKVYDAIATQWHHTRGKRGVLWPSATQFVQNLSEGSLVADVGCGDGKYFPAIWEAGSYVIGTDISLPLLETSVLAEQENVPESRRVGQHRRGLQKRPAVAVADCMFVPLRSKSCDAAICIAVMHHLSTTDRRIRCLEELSRIVKPNGRIHVQAWAMEQASNSKRRFAATDVFVPFNAQPKYLDKVNECTGAIANEVSKSVAEQYSEAYEKADFDERKGLVVFQRYCHMYREGELDNLVRQIPSLRLVESGYESGNHYVIVKVVAD